MMEETPIETTNWVPVPWIGRFGRLQLKEFMKHVANQDEEVSLSGTEESDEFTLTGETTVFSITSDATVSNPEPSTSNPEPSTSNPEPSTSNPEPSTSNVLPLAQQLTKNREVSWMARCALLKSKSKSHKPDIGNQVPPLTEKEKELEYVKKEEEWFMATGKYIESTKTPCGARDLDDMSTHHTSHTDTEEDLFFSDPQ